MADIVMPATMFPEHDDIYSSYGHTILQISKSFLTPPVECRHNHAVVSALAERLGVQHPAFSMSPWEIIDNLLDRSSLPDAKTLYQKGGHDMAPSFRKMHFLDGFGHKDRKFHFLAAWETGEKSFPDHKNIIDEVTQEKPFHLVTAPAHNFLNSSFTETEASVKREERPSALIHKKICVQRLIKEGDLIRIGNERGSVLLWACPVEGQDQSTIIVEGLWKASAFPEGKGIDCLTSAQRCYPEGGGRKGGAGRGGSVPRHGDMVKSRELRN